jgi:hypothetical protein
VARALLLQAAIRRSHRLVVRLTGLIDGAQRQLRELRRRGENIPVDPHAGDFLTQAVRDISHIVRLLAKDERFRVQSTGVITSIETAVKAALDAQGSRPSLRGRKSYYLFSRVWFRKFVLPHTQVEGLGYIPVLSLAAGTLGLFISVILFAAKTQPRDIWITCCPIFVGILTCAMFTNYQFSL